MTRPLTILYISREYPPETACGGIATYTHAIATGLARRGHTIHVVCCAPSGERYSASQDGVVVHRVPPGDFPLPTHRVFFPLRRICRSVLPETLVRAAWSREAKTESLRLGVAAAAFDIIEYPECGAEGFFLSKFRNVPTITRLHTPWEMVCRLDNIHQGTIDTAILSHMERAAARRSRAVTSPTAALAAIAEKSWKIRPATVFPNPLTATDFRQTAGQDWIYIGRVEYRKGVHLLIEAFSLLSQRRTTPRLRLVGRPFGSMPEGISYEEHIERLLSAHGVGNAVEWVKGVAPREIREFLSRSSVAVFPSIWENLSYACLEAMASGLAVVASRCGGFTEMITHGVNGLLFDPGEPRALASALEALIDSPELTGRLGNQARTTVRETYDAAKVCPRVESFYHSLIQECGRG